MKSLGLVLGRRPLGAVLHSSSEPGKLSQWFCHHDSTTNIGICIIITRHSLVRAKGEVFVLLLLFCSFFCQRFLDNPRANLRQILHAGVLWFRMCLLPFWGLAAPGGRKKGEMNFLLLWESMGNFCILAVFERYLSNACTDPHQILFV